jgi:myo-inositol 2-dehydrogenase/D-chiro-inositol 1-dehydrogenase
VSCWQWDSEPPAPEFRLHSGGIAIDMGVHELDQVRWLTGQEIDEVTALPGGTGRDEYPEVAGVLVRMSGGTLGVIALGCRFPLPDSCWASVIGTEDYVRVPFMWGADGERAFLAGLRAQAEAFGDAVRGGPLLGASGEDAAQVLDAAELVGAALAPAKAAS